MKLTANKYLVTMIHNLAKYFIVLFVSVIVGVGSIVFPWFISVGLVIAILYCIVVWNFPWFSLGIYVVAAMFLPDFKLSDVLTVVTAFILIIRQINNRQSFFWLNDLIKKYYLCFLLIVFLSTLLGVFYFHNSVSFIYRDFRIFIYWLWLPIIGAMLFNGTNKEELLRKISYILMGVGIIVASMAIIQFFTGIQIVAVGRVGALETAGADQGGFTRVQLPGYPFVVWSLLFSIVLVVKKKISFIWFSVLVLIFSLALLVNFGRGLWVWSFVGMLLTGYFYTKQQRLSFILGFCLLGLVSVLSITVIKPDFAEAIVVRLLSVKAETAENWGPKTSYEWRQLENSDAKTSIMRSPLLGVGVGGEYRHRIWELRNVFEDHTRFIHNSYFFFLIKFGIFGLIAFISFICCSWYYCFVNYKWMPESVQPVFAASLAIFPAYCCLSVTQPEFVNANSVLFFAILFSLFSLGMKSVNVKSLYGREAE